MPAKKYRFLSGSLKTTKIHHVWVPFDLQGRGSQTANRALCLLGCSTLRNAKLKELIRLLLLRAAIKLLFDGKPTHVQTFIGSTNDLKHALKSNVGCKFFSAVAIIMAEKVFYGYHSDCLWPPLQIKSPFYVLVGSYHGLPTQY